MLTFIFLIYYKKSEHDTQYYTTILNEKNHQQLTLSQLVSVIQCVMNISGKFHVQHIPKVYCFKNSK